LLRLQAFRRDCDQLPPLAVYHYLHAALSRPSIKHLVPEIRCRMLLIYGGQALHKQDCLELATQARKDRFAIMEVPQASRAPLGPLGVVSEHLPAARSICPQHGASACCTVHLCMRRGAHRD
jgi:hypothetical protein